MLLKNSPVPLYHQLLEIFHDLLDNRTWQPGQLIPTEKQLAEEFDVSLATVRRALFSLENEGKIIRKRGKGSYVSEERTAELPIDICEAGLYNFAKQTSHIRVFDAEAAPMTLRGTGAQSFMVRRLYMEGGKPYCFHTITMAQRCRDALQNLSKDDYRFAEGIIRNIGGYDSMLVTIEAVQLSSYEAQVLEGHVGALALLYNKTYFRENETIMIEKFIFKHAKLSSTTKYPGSGGL